MKTTLGRLLAMLLFFGAFFAEAKALSVYVNTTDHVQAVAITTVTLHTEEHYRYYFERYHPWYFTEYWDTWSQSDYWITVEDIVFLLPGGSVWFVEYEYSFNGWPYYIYDWSIPPDYYDYERIEWESWETFRTAVPLDD